MPELETTDLETGITYTVVAIPTHHLKALSVSIEAYFEATENGGKVPAWLRGRIVAQAAIAVQTGEIIKERITR